MKVVCLGVTALFLFSCVGAELKGEHEDSDPKEKKTNKVEKKQEENSSSTVQLPEVNKENGLDLSPHGLHATITKEGLVELDSGNYVKDIDFHFLPHSYLKLSYENNLEIRINDAEENTMKEMLEFSKMVNDSTIIQEDNYFLIQNNSASGETKWTAYGIHEKDGHAIAFRIMDKDAYMFCTSLEQAKKGLAIYKSFEWK